MGSKKGSSNNLQEQVRGLALKLEGVQLKTEGERRRIRDTLTGAQATISEDEGTTY